ncbi:hypothetical protein D9615_008688 [Tricholomella constricta]|uniref:HNH nuclease domain-containing protein n=1 Tax=Tricholomella constricta TaxID=117010 RepID=A0A8H5M0V6_9AGAR|nr:hypothetical protein D9615_008688 [Tricholomella constricta]
MDKHALAVLEEAQSWEWPLAKRIQKDDNMRGKYEADTPKLLYHLIIKSQELDGSVLDQFWDQVGTCHPKLAENIDHLRNDPHIVAPSQSSAALFEGVDRTEVDFTPVFKMASEYFTHLAIAFMNPDGPKSESGTPHSVSTIVSSETDELLRVAKEEGKFGTRKQASLKDLAFRRDGDICPISGMRFDRLPGGEHIDPILAHLIPHSVHGKPDTMKCIAMFAGEQVRDLVQQHLNGPGNVFNLESNVHTAFDNLKWGIEAQVDNGKVKYIYRRVPSAVSHPGPGTSKLRDGDEIVFGKGKEAAKLGSGPLPFFCNMHLAISRVLKMSGAAQTIAQLKEDADDSDFAHVFLSSSDFCDILDAQLLLAGGKQDDIGLPATCRRDDSPRLPPSFQGSWGYDQESLCRSE